MSTQEVPAHGPEPLATQATAHSLHTQASVVTRPLASVYVILLSGVMLLNILVCICKVVDL